MEVAGAEVSETAAAVIVNDEGGPVTITGSVEYTDTFSWPASQSR